MFQTNLLILILLLFVLYLAVTKYCMGLTTGQCSANILGNLWILLKYLIDLLWNMIRGVGQGVVATQTPTFDIYKNPNGTTKKKDAKKDIEAYEEEEFTGNRINTLSDFEQSKRELEEEIRRLQGDL